MVTSGTKGVMNIDNNASTATDILYMKKQVAKGARHSSATPCERDTQSVEKRLQDEKQHLRLTGRNRNRIWWAWLVLLALVARRQVT